MPFDPDELANGLLRFMQDGRDPPAGPPPAEMPGSGPSIQELQEQIKALQEQLKGLEGDADVPMAPRDRTPGEPHYPLGPGRDAPRLTPDDYHKRDWEMFDKWRKGSGGEPHYAMPRKPDIDPDFYIPADPNAPDIDPDFYIPADPIDADIDPGFYRGSDKPYIPHPVDADIKADMPSWGPYGQPGAEYDIERIPSPSPQEKPHWQNLPYRSKEPTGGQPYELLNGTGSPVEGLNLKVGRHGNNYYPSTVTPGKGASLN